jgi:RNA polymerase sigma factor (sigma-70 family)
MSGQLPGATLFSVTRSLNSRSSRTPKVDGDHYADWDEIYSDNVERLYRMMYAKVGNRADAEDLTAEVFLAALRPLRIGASRPEVRGYLAATAQSTLASYWRRRFGAEATRIELAAALRFLDDPQTDSYAGVRAQRLLDCLPERYRQILELRFLDTLTLKGAAATMGVSVANAKVLQHRALRMAAKTTAAPELVSIGETTATCPDLPRAERNGGDAETRLGLLAPSGSPALLKAPHR